MMLQKLLSVGIMLGLSGGVSLAPSLAWAAETLEGQQQGKLVVAVKDNVRPLGFRDAEGNLQGFEIDLARRLAQKLFGDPEAVVLQPVSNAERLNLVAEGKVDLAIARVTYTEARSRLVDFSHYYYLDSTSLVTRNPTVKDLEDLAQAKIAVLEDSSTIAVVRSTLPDAQLVGVPSYQAALATLEAGEAQAFAADASVLTGWVQEYPQYRQLPVQLSTHALCVILPKGLQYEGLRQQVNDAIARWRESGWLRQTAQRWGLP